MTDRLTLPRRLMLVALVVSIVVVIAPPTTAWAAANSACTSDGKPMRDGTYTVTSPYGPRSSGFHEGMDLGADLGTDIFAAFDGTVSHAGSASGFGQWIVIDTQTRTGLISTVYGHMYPEDLFVEVGQAVTKGQLISKVGNNGQSTGPHLHFEYRIGGVNGPDANPDFIVNGTTSSGDSSTAQSAAASAQCQTGVLRPGSVPDIFVEWLIKADRQCEEDAITAPLLAAQLEAENNFRHGDEAPSSPDGAQGPAQFMPGTWDEWGVDADGVGGKDVSSVPDAVMAQGAYMCENYRLSEAGVAAKKLVGDPVALALAAYNAGFGSVQEAGGMPEGGEFTTETGPYVYGILQRVPAFEASPSINGNTQAPTGDTTELNAIVAAATEYKDTKWVWGGGDLNGPTRDGFDSSGLTYFAVAKGTGGRLLLPRTADLQWNIGDQIGNLADVKPGDLVFSGWDQNDRPSHVGIAIGNGQIIHADRDRGVVIADYYPESKARSVA